MVQFSSLALWACASVLPSLCTASNGAKLNMYACVYYEDDPKEPFDVYFTAGSSDDSCMTQRGNNANTRVTSKGLTCESLGVVESDTSGSCFFKLSFWGMSYVANGASGSVKTQWGDHGNSAWIELRKPATGINVCRPSTEDKPCSSIEQYFKYDKSQDMLIIFSPPSPSVSTSLTVQVPDL